VLPPVRTNADILPNVGARSVADSLSSGTVAGTRSTVQSTSAGDLFQVLGPASQGGGAGPGGFVLAALPSDIVPPSTQSLAAADTTQEIYDGKLPPTAAGPMSAVFAQAFVPTAPPGDMPGVTGMITSEGGARINTAPTRSTRRSAASAAVPLRKPSAARPAAAVSGQGLARLGAGVVTSLPGVRLGNGTGVQVPGGEALRLPSDAANGLSTSPSGAVAAVTTNPAPTAQAPAVAEVSATPTPKRSPDQGGSSHKGAIVIGGLFAAAAGFTLRKRLVRKS
jgi:hypothetical protein